MIVCPVCGWTTRSAAEMVGHMSRHGKPTLQARFQKLQNDLFWEIFDREQEKFIKWMGYDDYYWWNNVAKSDEFQVRGKYRLDPLTNTVSIVE